MVHVTILAFSSSSFHRSLSRARLGRNEEGLRGVEIIQSRRKKEKTERMSSAVYAHECFMSEKAPPGKPSFILWNLLCACSLMNWRYHRMHRPSPEATQKQVAAFHSRKLTESFSNWKTFPDKSLNLNYDCMTSYPAVNEPCWRKRKKSSSQLNFPHICAGFHCAFRNESLRKLTTLRIRP